MRLFAPRLHGYYSTTLNALCAKHPTLTPNFSNNVFGTATFNLGPRTVSYAHVDQKNLPWGWCTITAAGEFDPVCSGHLILWDLEMFIEFPPGATVLIPSALLCHSNTTIAPHERRYSFTQYTAGGIVRWMESGFQPVSKLPRKRAKEVYAEGLARWERGVQMLSLWSEFAEV